MELCTRCYTPISDPTQHGLYVCPLEPRREATTSVIGDELPVGYAAQHGVCHADGTPRRFDTMTELKRALNEKGLCIVGDTPGKPYKVNWSGRVKKNVG